MIYDDFPIDRDDDNGYINNMKIRGYLKRNPFKNE